MVWGTGPRTDPRRVAHAMLEDYHGRPTAPLCGRSSNGLWFYAHTAWDHVPNGRRCLRCADVLPGIASPG